jgi:hypothetical protein
MTESNRLASGHPGALRAGLLRALALAALLGLGSCGGGGGGDREEIEACGTVCTGFLGNFSWEHGADGAGGVGDGASGDGGVGAGGDFGQFRNALVTVRLRDGVLLGSARTDPSNGMVTIYPGRDYDGPLYIELTGGDGATYYEEGTKQFVPFPADARIRVYVPRVKRNIGITAFTEAAVQLLTEGSTPERVDGTPDAAQIAAANERIRSTLAQQLPQAMQVDDIARLPFIKSPDIEGRNAMTLDARGVYGLASGAFSKQAAMYNPNLSAPTLQAMRQLAADLRDGRLDGMNGTQPAVPADQRTYDPHTLTGELSSALAEQQQRFGDESTRLALPELVHYASTRYEGYLFDAAIPPDGAARTNVAGWVAGNSRGFALGQAFPKFGAGVRTFALYGNAGHGGLFMKVDGGSGPPQLYALGDNVYGELGLGDQVDTDGQAKPVALPGVPTHIAGGAAHTVARLADGSVWTWGDNLYGQLGQGQDGTQLPRSTTPLRVTLPAGAVAVAASHMASFALLADGSVYAWGSSWGFGLLGDGQANGVRLAPAAVRTPAGPLADAVQLSARDHDAVVLKRDGSVWQWGSFPADAAGAYTDGDATSPYRGGHVWPTQLQGLPAGVGVRKVITEQGLTVALLDDGRVYTWGVYHDLTADKLLRDLTATRVLSLPPVRDLMPGGYIGYGARPFDRTTAMAIGYQRDASGSRDLMFKIRGRVAERFDPQHPERQRRPQHLSSPPENCADCHVPLSRWPTDPLPTSGAICVPPPSILELVHADTDCRLCHNADGAQLRLALGALQCVPPSGLPERTRSDPAPAGAACTLPGNHPFTPPGTVCASCHNSVIARTLAQLGCSQPDAGALPSIATTVTIGQVLDDGGLTVLPGALTADGTPEIRGSLSAPLAAGQAVVVRRNGVVIGQASATGGTTWSFTDAVASNGDEQSYTARVESAGDGAFGMLSNRYAVRVDSQAPAQTVTLTAITGNGVPVADNDFTADTTPAVAGSLSGALAAGEVVQVLRNGALAGNASVSGTAWSYVEPDAAPLAAGSYGYSARVVDAVGRQGVTSATRTVRVTTLPQADVTQALRAGTPITGPTNFSTPTLVGSLSTALQAGQQVRLLRDGAALQAAVTVTGTSWSVVDTLPTPIDARVVYSARVEAGSLLGTPGATVSIQVDTVAPTAVPTITGFFDQFTGQVVAPGGSSSDTTPSPQGTLTAGLAAGETVRVLRDAVAAGSVTPSSGATSWRFDDGARTAGRYVYLAQVVDAAGNVGRDSVGAAITVDTTRRTVTLDAVIDDERKLTIARDGAGRDRTPALTGVVNLALLPGQSVRVVRVDEATKKEFPLGNATVGTSATNPAWNFSDPGTGADGRFTYRAEVVEPSGALGSASAGYTVVIDTTPPTQTAPTFFATSAVVPFNNTVGADVDSVLGSVSSDTSPRLVIGLSAPPVTDNTLIASERMEILRTVGKGAPEVIKQVPTTCPINRAGLTCVRDTPTAANVTAPVRDAKGTIINLPTTAGLPTELVTYAVRVVDAAGNVGPTTEIKPALAIDHVTCDQQRATAAAEVVKLVHPQISFEQRASKTGVRNCSSCHQAVPPPSTEEVNGTPLSVTLQGALVPVPMSAPTYWCRRPG